MRACRSVGSVLSLILPVGIVAAVTGCQPEAPAPTPPVVRHTPAPMYASSPDIVVMPGTKVGIVANVDAPSMQAAVTMDDMTGVKVGDILTFTDRAQNVIGGGEVTSITAPDNGGHTFVMVKYKPVNGQRAPMMGDIAVGQPKG